MNKVWLSSGGGLLVCLLLTMWPRIRSTFFVGLLAFAPLAITLYVLILLVAWFDQLFQPFVQQLPFFGRAIPGVGLVVGILFIFALGVIAPSILGKQILVVLEKIMDRLPLAKLVYSGSKQIFDSFGGDAANRFNRVVLIEFPRAGAFTLGFVTSEYSRSIHHQRPDLRLAVFVPTTPNPTSGYLLYVAEADTQPVSLSVEEALKVVISGGLARPAQYNEPSLVISPPKS